MTALKMALNGDILFTASRQYRRYDIVKAEGIRKVQCSSDPEAKQFAARMSCEQFRIPGEKINIERFSALGVALSTYKSAGAQVVRQHLS